MHRTLCRIVLIALVLILAAHDLPARATVSAFRRKKNDPSSSRPSRSQLVPIDAFVKGEYGMTLALCDQLERTRLSSSREAEVRYVRALALIALKDYASARQVLEPFAHQYRKSPYLADASLALGAVYLRLHEYDKARQALLEVVENKARNDARCAAIYTLAELSAEQGDAERLNEYRAMLAASYPDSFETVLAQRLSIGVTEAYEKKGEVCFTVQVGSFVNKAKAEEQYRSLFKETNTTPYIEPATVGTKTYYRVRIGRFRSREKAVELCETLKKKGFDATVCP